METIKKHLALFPSRLRSVLEQFSHWETVCEIRLRLGAPLSLTSHNGNVMLNGKGRPCSVSEAVLCKENELFALLGAFCGGSVYRYFERLEQGFAVDEDGWRLGVSSLRSDGGVFLPNKIAGINLRIPVQAPLAAKPILDRMEAEGVRSLLICSAPGEGKTTLLRSLATMLSVGRKNFSPLRVAVIDERGELFPSQMCTERGLLDVLPFYEKGKGIELATRLFSPQVILCDEIGSETEAEAVLNACSGGCYVVATAHASSLQEAKETPYLRSLLKSGKFREGLFIRKTPAEFYKCSLEWVSFS